MASYLWYFYKEKQFNLKKKKKEAYSSWMIKQFFPGLVATDRELDDYIYGKEKWREKREPTSLLILDGRTYTASVSIQRNNLTWRKRNKKNLAASFPPGWSDTTVFCGWVLWACHLNSSAKPSNSQSEGIPAHCVAITSIMRPY